MSPCFQTKDIRTFARNAIRAKGKSRHCAARHNLDVYRSRSMLQYSLLSRTQRIRDAFEDQSATDEPYSPFFGSHNRICIVKRVGQVASESLPSRPSPPSASAERGNLPVEEYDYRKTVSIFDLLVNADGVERVSRRQRKEMARRARTAAQAVDEDLGWIKRFGPAAAGVDSRGKPTGSTIAKSPVTPSGGSDAWALTDYARRIAQTLGRGGRRASLLFVSRQADQTGSVEGTAAVDTAAAAEDAAAVDVDADVDGNVDGDDDGFVMV